MVTNFATPIFRTNTCKMPLLRPPLVLPKSALICGAVLLLNVEHSSTLNVLFNQYADIFLISLQNMSQRLF